MSIDLSKIIRETTEDINKTALEADPTMKESVKEWTGAGAVFGGGLGGITAGSIAAGIVDKNQIVTDVLEAYLDKIPKGLDPSKLIKEQSKAVKLSNLSPAAVIGLIALTGAGIGAATGAGIGAGAGAGLHRIGYGKQEKTASEILDELYKEASQKAITNGVKTLTGEMVDSIPEGARLLNPAINKARLAALATLGTASAGAGVYGIKKVKDKKKKTATELLEELHKSNNK